MLIEVIQELVVPLFLGMVGAGLWYKLGGISSKLDSVGNDVERIKDHLWK